MIRERFSPKTDPRTSLDTYLRDIGRTPLLSAQEEKDLAYRINRGDHSARDHMVRANLRLVVNIARKFAGPGQSLDDLIEEGNLGLLKAAERYDPSHNTRFSTYAVYWIRQSIQDTIANRSRTIRIPAYMNDLASKWRKTTAALEDELGRTPTDEEVAGRLDLPLTRLPLVKHTLRTGHVMPLSTAAEEDPYLEQNLLDPRSVAPDTDSEGADDRHRLRSLLGRLNPREARVVQLRFGLDGEEPRSLQEISAEMGVTRERIRQIQNRALDKLRVLARAG